MPLLSLELLEKHKNEWIKLRNELRYDIIDQGFGAYMNFKYHFRDGKLGELKNFDEAYEYIKEKYIKKV
tara:strand:- start:1471 stop:1677 length:207 start_codon:yes stop_codon:yes gene_type:complete